jgi:ATP-dependent Lon protease
MAEPKVLPLIPLRNIVVFPGMVIPLYVGRKHSLAAVEYAASTEDKSLLLSAQQDSGIEEPQPIDLFELGTLAKIVQLLRLPNGTVKVLVEGITRVSLSVNQQKDPYFTAGYAVIQDVCVVDEKLEQIVKQVIEKFDAFVKTNKKIPVETLMSVINVEDPGKLSDLIASYLTLSLEEKQKLLATPKVYERLSILYGFCVREVGLIQVEKGLDSDVQGQIEKIQREYFLKEKIKAIQKELGETQNFSEIDEYRQKIVNAKLPENIEQKVLKELLRLEKMQSLSAEASVVRTYLDYILELPWQSAETCAVNIKRVKEVLDEDHFGLEKVKDRILEYLAVYCTTQRQSGSIILLSGPPGVGKTSIAQSIARSLGREFYRVSLGGLRDEAELRGHRRTYVGSMPGKIIHALLQTKTRNPVILLDEIDKLSQNYKGDPSAVLMEILDPSQNKSFTDNYLEFPFDLSQILFLATANTEYEIYKPLLDRMEVIKLSGYTEEEKVDIAQRFLVPRLLAKHGLPADELTFTRVGLYTMITEYTREAGLRSLERCLDEVCRKYVRSKLEKKRVFTKVSKHNLVHYLGNPKHQDDIDITDEVGVAKGLAWTESGGDVLPVEVTVLKGKGVLTLTGHLGEIMQESAKTALSFVRSRSNELGIEMFHDTTDIHIHVPEGAIAKDGPSAGITLAVALASALSGLPVRGNVAMTGEITLRGKVLGIGGLKEKVLAAARAGIDTILFPADNKNLLDEIPKKSRKKMKFIPVKTMDDVFFFSLKGYQRQDKKNKPVIEPRVDQDEIRPELS